MADCVQETHRFKYKSVFVMNFINETHDTTMYFRLSIIFKNQHGEMKESIEISKQIVEMEKGESGYTFASITKSTMKMFRQHDRRASSFCKLPNPICKSKSIKSIQTTDNYSFPWCNLAHKNTNQIITESKCNTTQNNLMNLIVVIYISL